MYTHSCAGIWICVHNFIIIAVGRCDLRFIQVCICAVYLQLVTYNNLNKRVQLVYISRNCLRV